MERRYRVLAELGVRNIDAYNRKVVELQEAISTGPRKKTKLTKGQSMDVDEAPGLKTSIEERTTLPYIVVVIDEFADLMMVAPKDIEDRIARLAQMARAFWDPSHFSDSATFCRCGDGDHQGQFSCAYCLSSVLEN